MEINFIVPVGMSFDLDPPNYDYILCVQTFPVGGNVSLCIPPVGSSAFVPMSLPLAVGSFGVLMWSVSTFVFDYMRGFVWSLQPSVLILIESHLSSKDDMLHRLSSPNHSCMSSSRVEGNARHITSSDPPVYNMAALYALMCASGSVVPLYLSRSPGILSLGISTFIMSSVKGLIDCSILSLLFAIVVVLCASVNFIL
ncbi:uncharacterized protein G2W53_039300 [Senna tora]|uniref:Uncharacterized protein n=1 Tax=Senna tora TaxID=362788 RepID=A0A834W7V2_9FABA|nr:uncharacterized protein G2W53_039300 [Senna tora]